MFEWLFFWRRKPVELPPTEKQKRYARSLQISIPPNITRQQLSILISQAKANGADLRNLSPELLAAAEQWDALADQEKWLAFAYADGKKVRAGMGLICGTSIKAKKLFISIDIAKILEHGFVDSEETVDFDSSKFLWSQVIDGFELEETDRFRTTLREVEKKASQLPPSTK